MSSSACNDLRLWLFVVLYSYGRYMVGFSFSATAAVATYTVISCTLHISLRPRGCLHFALLLLLHTQLKGMVSMDPASQPKTDDKWRQGHGGKPCRLARLQVLGCFNSDHVQVLRCAGLSSVKWRRAPPNHGWRLHCMQHPRLTAIDSCTPLGLGPGGAQIGAQNRRGQRGRCCWCWIGDGKQRVGSVLLPEMERIRSCDERRQGGPGRRPGPGMCITARSEVDDATANRLPRPRGVPNECGHANDLQTTGDICSTQLET
jgi:hypothetical protein